jgi:hypothetical protein
MTRSELLLMARRDQRHTALEEAVAPLDVLPGDLLTVLVDAKPEATPRSAASWELHGFVMRGTKDAASWYLVVSGNAVSCEYWLREHGFDRAFAGSPTHVKVRVATDDEVAAYLAA